MYKNITGIILSGGKSSRMGVNKSLLNLGGKPVIKIITDLMTLVFEKNLLSTNSFDEYTFLQLPMVADVVKDQGPLGGIYSALTESTTESNFIISCDVPLMNQEMIEYLVNYKTEKQISICKAASFVQPLVGLYNKSLLPIIQEILSGTNSKSDGAKQHRSLHSLIKKADAEIIDPSPLSFYSDKLFFNLNNKEDFNGIQKGVK